MFKPVIYVIYIKYEFLSFLIFIGNPTPHLNCKFENLTISLQRMTLFLNFKHKAIENNFFILINISTCS